MREESSQQKVVWVNGDFIDSDNISVSAVDPGVTVGLGVFDSLCCYDGKPFDYLKHYQRLADGARRLNLELLDSQALHSALVSVVERNGFKSGKCRLRVTVLAGEKQQKTIVSAGNMPQRGESSRVIISHYRVNEFSPLAGVKSTSYAMNIIALQEAQTAGADEALFLNTSGKLCEGATSNLFLVSDGVVQTPSLSTGCLPGVARDTVIELCEGLGIKVEECDLSLDDLSKADAIFLTSSLREVQVVESIDGQEQKSIDDSIVSRLKKAYKERTHGDY